MIIKTQFKQWDPETIMTNHYDCGKRLVITEGQIRINR